MKKAFVVIVASLAVLSVGACAGVGKGKGKAPAPEPVYAPQPPVISKG